MKGTKGYILEDIEKLNGGELTKLYKFIRREIIANVSKSDFEPLVRQGVPSADVCEWTRAFDGHFNLSCANETNERGNGQFKGKEIGAKWEFTYCPYCGRKIVSKSA